MSDRDNDFGAFLAGFVVGGLVGAAVALLLAPQTGEETRTLIHDRSIELKDKAVERAEEARVKAEAAAAEARARAEEISKLTMERAAELKKKGQDVYQQGKTRISSVVTRKKPAEGEAPAETEVPVEG
jgi:gas vesicle protein